MKAKNKMISAGLAAMLLAAPAWGIPTIVHDPIQVAEKGQPLGVKATVRDAAARVDSASLFYAASRGMTPFRVSMSSSGAGIWYATIPGHMIGPGNQMFYYIQAENADGETRETDWQTVKVVERGVAPAAIPAASDVAREAQRTAVPATVPARAPASPPARSGKSKYLMPAAIIVGGAVAVGGALALAGGGGGGGGGGSGTVEDGNFGGNYNVCFESTSVSNNTTTCDSGPVNVYVSGGTVEIVGLWGSEVITTPLNGQTFSVTKSVSATTDFPDCSLILAGEFNGDTCTASVNGYSQDPLELGNLNGTINTTRR